MLNVTFVYSSNTAGDDGEDYIGEADNNGDNVSWQKFRTE